MGAEAASPWDLYREIHKAMRLALFGVTTRAGATAPSDDDSRLQALLDEWRDVRFVLEGHHQHEDRFCDPLIRDHAPQLRDALEAAHRESDAAIARIEALAAALPASHGADRQVRLQGLHLALADFTADYLRHLRYEESEVMPALNRAMSNAALEAVTNDIRMSVPPPEMCVFIRYMVPSMNFDERLDMLGGMHKGAPPEIFEMFRAAAEGCLPPAEYQAVARAAGFG
jgi:hypothetical protein